MGKWDSLHCGEALVGRVPWVPLGHPHRRAKAEQRGGEAHAVSFNAARKAICEHPDQPKVCNVTHRRCVAVLTTASSVGDFSEAPSPYFSEPSPTSAPRRWCMLRWYPTGIMRHNTPPGLRVAQLVASPCVARERIDSALVDEHWVRDALSSPTPFAFIAEEKLDPQQALFAQLSWRVDNYPHLPTRVAWVPARGPDDTPPCGVFSTIVGAVVAVAPGTAVGAVFDWW